MKALTFSHEKQARNSKFRLFLEYILNELNYEVFNFKVFKNWYFWVELV